MRVFLIGYMGVGKTTIGKKLAKSLSLIFIDLDQFISSKKGMPIAEIIHQNGEEYFRLLEKKYLLELCEKNDVLISTGGGTPCFFDNMEVINKKGRSVFLEMDEKSLAKRLINGLDSRPLLKGKNLDELEAFISEHLKSRMPYYEKSNITFSALNFNSNRVKELAQLIKEIK